MVRDVRYGKVWEDVVIPPIQIAIRTNEEGKRQMLAFVLGSRKSQTSWKGVLQELKRGLGGWN